MGIVRNHVSVLKCRIEFLWVFFQIEDLMDALDPEQSSKLIHTNLLQGLTATYNQIMERIVRSPLRQIG